VSVPANLTVLLGLNILGEAGDLSILSILRNLRYPNILNIFSNLSNGILLVTRKTP